MKRGNAGEGLPNLERLIIKYFIVPVVRLFFTWNLALFFLNREKRIIKELTKGLNEEQLNKQVLIHRAFAIEDHSRDYSINMALEHLTITGNAIVMLINSLSQEKEFKREITIEGVKPKNDGTFNIEEFFIFMDKYSEYIKKHNKKQSTQTKKHPWFVNFNNADWNCFMFMHTFIHRRQIQTIMKGL